MMVLSHWRDIERMAVTSATEPVRALLNQRRAQLIEDGFALEEVGRFLVVEPGDRLVRIEAELGFSPLVNFVTGDMYGSPGFTPSFEWVADHDGILETVFILTDDGFAWVLLVPDDDSTEPSLLAMLRQHVTPAVELARPFGA